MKIEVNVSDLDLGSVISRDYEGDSVTLADVVAEKLVARAAGDEPWSLLRDRITQIRDEEIRALVVPLIEEAFAKPIQRTNSWGEPTGDPIELRDVVIEEARKLLNGVKGDSFNRQEPLARKLINEMVSRELRQELSEAIKEERAKVIEAVRSQAANLITEAVTKGVGGR